MKTLTKDDVSLWLFDDDEVIRLRLKQAEVGDPVRLFIADCDRDNSVLHDGVTAPEDWEVGKYLYTESGGWALNSEWTEPVEPSEAS